MSRDEIIRMAREAGGRQANCRETYDLLVMSRHDIERLARAAYAAGAAAEREACAKVCEDMSDSDWWPTQCAAAIRARGQK